MVVGGIPLRLSAAFFRLLANEYPSWQNEPELLSCASQTTVPPQMHLASIFSGPFSEHGASGTTEHVLVAAWQNAPASASCAEQTVRFLPHAQDVNASFAMRALVWDSFWEHQALEEPVEVVAMEPL